MSEDPTGTPLPRLPRGELREADLHTGGRRVGRDSPIGREQGHAEFRWLPASMASIQRSHIA